LSRIKRTTVFLLSVLLLFLVGCGSNKGRTVYKDGYTIRTEKSASEASEPVRQIPERNSAVEEIREEEMRDYVLNKNSKKFHDPSCSGAAEIKASNRWEYRGSRQSVLDMGYTPCKLCNP